MTKQSMHQAKIYQHTAHPPSVSNPCMQTSSPQYSETTNTASVNIVEEKSLKKDVLWQNREPQAINSSDEGMESLLSSLFSTDHVSISDEFLNDFDIFAFGNTPDEPESNTASSKTLLSYDKTETDSGYSTDSTDSKRRAALDSVSSTSDDSVASLESVEDGYRMTNNTNNNTTSQNQQLYQTSQQSRQSQQQQRKNNTDNKVRENCTPSKTRRKIEPIYNNDPYLQRHRLMVNARQKNRMMKLNKMYTTLNSLIPENVACEPNTKPHSKLGVLKRAIVYWRSLSAILMENPPPSLHSNAMKIDNSEHSLMNTQHSAAFNLPDRLNSGNACSSYTGQLRIKSEKL